MKKILCFLIIALWAGVLSAQTTEKNIEAKLDKPLLALLDTIYQDAKQCKKQSIMKEVCDYLKECGVYYLATVEGDQPRVRPFGTSVIFEDKLYIQTGKRKNVSKQMMANSKVEICAYNLSKGIWLRIEATVVPDERIEAKTYMLEQYPSLKRMYAVDDDNTQVLYLQNVTAIFYSFTDEPRVLKF